MKNFILRILVTATLVLSSLLVHAGTVADSVEIIDPYVRMIPPGAPATAAFMQIRNTDGKDHALVSAQGSINKITELHTHLHKNGMMQMRQVKQIDLPAGATTSLQPGGFHVMLIELTTPVKQGQAVTIDLTFEDGSTKTITAEGRPIKPMGMGSGKGIGQGMMMKMDHGMPMGQPSKNKGMMAIQHANPAFPNLIGVALKNIDRLGLSDDQVSKLQAWKKANGGKMKQMVQQIIKLENELIQLSLDGEDKTVLLKKFDQTLAIRKQVAQGKVACRDNMQKILTTKQFQQLADIYQAM